MKRRALSYVIIADVVKGASKMRRQNRASSTLIVALLFSTLFAPRISSAKSSKVSGEFYEITVSTTLVGEKQKATISTKGKGGYKCNEKYPWKLTIEPPEADGEKIVLRKKDASKLTKDEVVFEVSTVPSPGKKTVAKLKLSTCDDKQCKMATVELAW
jgi:stalled ribosome alternative rescue factor ArfA